MHEPGCAICRLALRTADHYITVYCSDNVTDIDIRAEMRSANGFCNTHAWALPDKRDALGLAITYGDIIKNLRRQLQDADAGRRRGRLGRWWFRLLRNWRLRTPKGAVFARPEPCPACRLQWRAEWRYAATFADYAGDPMLNERYRAGDGLCLGHVQLVAAAAADAAALELLTETESARWADLRARLDEIIRKADYRFSHESISPAEREALTEVLAAAAGRKGLTRWHPPTG